jgi:predicted nuclease of predicted toxin-antitoxin system
VRASRDPARGVVTFFIDRSLCQQQVAAALRARGANVEVHDDHFDQDAPDSEWLAAAGERGWVIISKDNRIRYRAAEVAAVTNAGAALFIFRGGNMRIVEIADALVAALSRMLRVVRKTRRPFIATVSKRGSVKIIRRPSGD